MFSHLLLQLAGFGLLLCPVVCAGGFAPCCGTGDVVEETTCCGCHGQREEKPDRCPTDDGQDRECIASRASVEAVSKSVTDLGRVLADLPSGPGADPLGVNRLTSGRQTTDTSTRKPALPVRTLLCALLL